MRDQVVVVTGASSGNGRAIAHAFACEGAKLVLSGRRENALLEAAAECRRLGGQAIVVPGDLGDHETVDELAAKALEQFGHIDIWVNCAAVMSFGRVEDTPFEIIEQVMRTNVMGYFAGARVAIRHFRTRGRGTLINISSVLGDVAQPYAAPYVASKAAITAMGDSLRLETAGVRDIHICTVLPYAIDTPIYQRAANYSGHRPQPVVPRYSPQDVARTAVHLAHRPRRQAVVGGAGRLAEFGKLVAPALTDQVVRLAIHTIELNGGPAQDSEGNVLRTVNDGWQVDGGWGSTRHGISLAAIAGLGLALTLFAISKTRR